MNSESNIYIYEFVNFKKFEVGVCVIMYLGMIWSDCFGCNMDECPKISLFGLVLKGGNHRI